MQINTNLMSINSQRALGRSENDVTRALQRMSSGLRVNSAKDDAAGLGIADRMSTQIRGMSQAARNANDGVSLLQTTEGALASVGDSLQRIRELAVQAANSSNSASDKQALQAEVNQLLKEIERVGITTQFNGEKVFAQGTQSIAGDKTQRAVLDALQTYWLEESEALVKDRFGIQGDGAGLSVELTSFTDGAGGALAAVQYSTLEVATGKVGNLKLVVDMADFKPPNLPNGGSAPYFSDRIIAHEMAHAVMMRSMNFNSLPEWFIEGSAEFIHGADERLKADIANAGGQAAFLASVDIATWGGTSRDYSLGYLATRYLHDRMKSAGNLGGVKDLMVYMNQNTGVTFDAALQHFFGAGNGTTWFQGQFNTNKAAFLADTSKINLNNADTGAIGNLDADGGSERTAENILRNQGTKQGADVLSGFTETFEKISDGIADSRQLQFQVGANQGQTLNATLGAMNLSALGLADVDISKQAQIAIVAADRALEYVNAERAKLGAQMSRLERTISALQSSSEAQSAARSRIVDADFASESAALVRAQILQQAGVAMVAQANVVPQLALQLLRQ